MAAPKNVIVFGLLGDIEASYGAGGSLVAGTHGILMADLAVAELDYVHDGSRPPAAGSGNTYKRTAKSGLFVKLPVKIEARGLGAAYTTTADKAQDLHTLLRASGHDLNLATGTWTASISAPGAEASGVFEAYSRGQKYVLTGALADMGFDIEGPGPMVFNFDISAIGALPTDVSLPSITYQALSVLPPKAESIALSIGSGTPFTAAVVRKISFKRNQTIYGPRVNVNTTGHSGFGLGRRNPTLELTIEATTLLQSGSYYNATQFNPYKLRELASSLNVTFTMNGGTNNKITFTAAQAQIVTVKDEADGDVALWTISLECKPSSPILNDDYTITLTA